MLQTTLLALLAFSAGLALHLRWHPRRREFSDAWDFLRLRQPLLWLVAGTSLLNGLEAEKGFSLAELNDWRGLWLPLLRRAFTEFALLFHMLVPPWPLALLLPLLLVVLTIRVWRWPYRYGERVPVPEQKLVLIALTAGSVLWAGLEALAYFRPELPEAVQTAKLAARTFYAALTAAGVQVWLVRLVIAYEKPPDTEADRDAVAALESTFARWQGVVALGGFNLLWMAWRSWIVTQNGAVAWVLPELLVLFAALPLAVAVSAGRSRFWHAGAVALKVLGRGLLVLITLGITAVALLALAHYTADMGLALTAETGLWRGVAGVLRALVLAMLHGWLCLAALLAMLRHGFPSSSPDDKSPAP